jgi:RND family efflux transporter MFP subunit
MREFSGEVKPRVESRLGFRVAGKVTRRQAEVGQRVKAGQLLAQLDPQDYRLAADAARAQVAAATTNRDLAAADLKRYQTLKEQNFFSGAEVERRESALKAAQAQVEQAQAQLSSQGNQARYTDLLADVSGVVTAVEVEPGQVVAAGTPIVRIAQDGPRDVVFAVPEDKIGALQPGGPVQVKVWAGNAMLPGRIREVAASADPITRTYPVKVALEGATQPPLGATVSVMPQALGHAGQQVIKLPTSALRQEGQGTAVWVLEKSTMTVRSQPVLVATADGNEAVIASGLQPGMLVVSAGVHVLSPGQKVTIWQDKTAAVPPLAGQPQLDPKAGVAQAGTLPVTR